MLEIGPGGSPRGERPGNDQSRPSGTTETTRLRHGEPCQAWGKPHTHLDLTHTRHATGLVMRLSPGGWLSWDIDEATDGGENGKNGRDKQWHTTTLVVGRKTHGNRTWSAYATPSQGDTSLVMYFASGPKPMAVLYGQFITLSGTHTLYVNAARAHSRSNTPWSEIGTQTNKHHPAAIFPSSLASPFTSSKTSGQSIRFCMVWLVMMATSSSNHDRKYCVCECECISIQPSVHPCLTPNSPPAVFT